MSNHTPKEPSEYGYERLRRLTIDVMLGKVYKNGKEVGSVGIDGYYVISIQETSTRQRLIKRSHVIFWAHHNRWPKSEVDHDDRNMLNDSISNLVESNRHLQGENREFKKTGLPTGVYPDPNRPRAPYRAAIGFDKKVHYIGNFQTPEDASNAYQRKLREVTNA